MHLSRPIAVLATMLLLAACGQSATSSSQSPSAADATASASAAATDGSGDGGSAGNGGGDAAAKLHAVVSGGQFAGTYDGSVPDGGCSRGATGKGSFGLQYSTADQAELSSFQLVVPDAKAASSGTDDFSASFTFGDLLNGTTVDVNPKSDKGSGTVSVDDRGDSATIKLQGESADGAKIDATVECSKVFDFGG
ncbi:MAG TPA: hypothetical protein VFK93_03180 [Candidatus Limnocylindria bacterium]|nr:hypothetical protein [Candidatus Limnocylindria bacterium]